jgi:hypothetical protein
MAASFYLRGFLDEKKLKFKITFKIIYCCRIK